MSDLNTNIGPERVQVFPKALGTVQVPGAGISNCAFLISTTLGGAPVNVATPVTTLDAFVTAFGGPDEVANDAYYAVKGFYDNGGTGNTAWIVNVGTTPTASSYIGSGSLGTGLRALDSVDSLGMVTAPGLPLDQAYLVQSALFDYTETIRSEYGAALSTSFSLASVPKEITKANTDTTVVTAQFLSVAGAGPWVMSIDTVSTSVAATGTYTVVDYTMLTGATATVAGFVLTEGVDWTAAVSNNATATSLAAAINALTAVNASAVGALITVVATPAGAAGNSVTLATSDAVNLTKSGATLTGGTNGNVALGPITAGMIVKNNAGTYTGVISARDDTLDTVTVTPDPTTFFTVAADVKLVLPSAVTYKKSVVSNAVSKAGAWYYNTVVVVDESSTALPGDLVVCDAIGHVAGVVARIDAQSNIGGPSHAPAGLQYASIAGINGLGLALSERLDAEPLRLNFINRITSFPGSGPVIFGGYTADNGVTPVFTADEQLIQVIRSLQFIKASLEPGLRSFIWENFSPATQGQINAAIESFLRNNSYLFPAGVPESGQFKVISVEPTQNELDQGLLRVRIQVRPNKAVRFVEISLEFPLPAA